ncbi:MAG: response regulator [Candidatus Protistobacter heckmanni]|nr:response regulator [Candidatus Protistobacter heckmanni]
MEEWLAMRGKVKPRTPPEVRQDVALRAFLSVPRHGRSRPYLTKPSLEAVEEAAEFEHVAITLRVLVAEDDAPTRIFLRSQLTALGHQVVCTANGEEALAALRKTSFDTLITDCRMSWLSGLEIAKILREEEQPCPPGTELTIIGLTASNNEADLRAAVKAGMSACLVKPISATSLHTLLSRHLCTSGTLGDIDGDAGKEGN